MTMSYILDAIRKSDHQRQLGATPTLQASPAVASVPARAGPAPNGWLLAAAVGGLVGAGVLAGWLMSEKQAPGPALPVPTVSPQPTGGTPSAQRAANTPLHADTPSALDHAQDLPQTNTPDRAPAPPVAVVSAEPVAEPKAAEAQGRPPALARVIGDVTIAFHVYSGNPADRRVMIDNTMLRQGETLPSGMKVEEITPDGVVLVFEGQRVRRGVRQ